MRILRILLFLGALAHAGQGQPADLEQRVRSVLKTGVVYGQDDKLFNASGDAAAVVLTKVLGASSTALSASDADMVLVIITESFAGSPGTAADREPRAALFVLKYLDCTTADPGLKQRIVDTRRNILEHYSKYLKAANQ